MQVEGEHDLFGDGAIVTVPTFGHTPGHQSLKVLLPAGDVVLAADAWYFKRTLDDLHLPKLVHNRAQMLDSLPLLRRLRGAGARIFYGHDPSFVRKCRRHRCRSSEAEGQPGLGFHHLVSTSADDIRLRGEVRGVVGHVADVGMVARSQLDVGAIRRCAGACYVLTSKLGGWRSSH